MGYASGGERRLTKKEELFFLSVGTSPGGGGCISSPLSCFEEHPSLPSSHSEPASPPSLASFKWRGGGGRVSKVFCGVFAALVLLVLAEHVRLDLFRVVLHIICGGSVHDFL